MIPTLLERDFNIPPIPELLGELQKVHSLQSTQDEGLARHG